MGGRDYFDQRVSAADGSVRVRCRPRGAELRDLTKGKGIDIVNWFSVMPGVLSLFGWFLHLTVYKREWFVTAEVATMPGDDLRVEGLNRKQAEAAFVHLIGWLHAGGSVATFVMPEISGRSAI